jgi:hypothetical protein
MTTAFDPKTAPPSIFPAQDAAVYEQIMGRWSRRLAPLLIGFGGLADGDRVLGVGCGTGSLSYALPEAANIAAVTGVDQPRCTSSMRVGAAPTRASRFGTPMPGHCLFPMARSTRVFQSRAGVHPPMWSVRWPRCAASSGWEGGQQPPFGTPLAECPGYGCSRTPLPCSILPQSDRAPCFPH